MIMRFVRSLLPASIALLTSTMLAAQPLDCRSTKQHLHGTAPIFKGGNSVELWPMDILHQRVELDLTASGTLSAACTVTATPREAGLTTLQLHLLQLTVDSVTSPFGTLPFTHVGELLTVLLPESADPGDTLEVTVHYRGTPATDASGFGGFYFAGAYWYNLGVAFTSVPHSYGRAWFPCVDNFTERNTYEFVVRTLTDRNAWCNGELVSETLDGPHRVRHWRLDNTIPAYLASVSAANYTALADTFQSSAGRDVPVALAALPADTANLRASFANLPIAFSCFEDWFGPYRWNKVGYVVTPLGAMEHATSIHYPRSIVNGNLQREDIMAHELGHEWFGNVVTCERAEEMYINEGFAEYLSYLFLECTYGRERYMQLMRSNHRTMVHRAHLLDEGWWALADVPQTWTYGEHSYNKAAAVIHSMRSYLGDENFRNGLTSFVETYAFQPVNTAQLRDHLTQTTGVDMTDFFRDWILQPGWASFEVDSFRTVTTNGQHTTTVHVQQKMRGPAEFYQHVPMRVACWDNEGNVWNAPGTVQVGNEHSSFTVQPPFVPRFVVLNPQEDLSLAVTVDNDVLSAPGTTTYSIADLRITVNSVPGPTPIRIEEYWVPADGDSEEGFAYVISPDRWWRIVGPIAEEASISARIQYDGRTNAAGWLDAGLMQNAAGVIFREDSLVLLYRPDQGSLWRPFPDHTVTVAGNPTDRVGRIDLNGLRAGEYAMAWRKSAVGIADQDEPANNWLLHPNPATDHIAITWRGDGTAAGILELVDASGRIVQQQRIIGMQHTMALQDLSAGTYLLRHVPLTGTAQVVDRVVVAR